MTILPGNTVSSASSYQTVCVNTIITPITHSATGATGMGICTGLPTGLTASWVANTITIAGTPTAAGVFNYTAPLTGGCGTVNAIGTITVLSGPGNATISGTTTTCAGTPVNLTITGTPGIVVTMTNGSSSTNLTIGASGSSVISVSPTTTTTYTLNSANLNTCSNSIIGQSATVTVSQTPQFINQIPDITVCNGGTLNIASQLTSTVPGTTFIWSSTASNVNISSINGDYTNINQIANLINSSQNGTINITIVPQIGNCSGASQQIIITVKSIPAIAATVANNTTICNNEFVTITSNSNPVATVYNWQINTANNVQIVGGATSGTSTTGIINLQLELSSPIMSGTISFNITPVNGICTGTTITNAVTITVNPIPGMPISLPINEICSGGTSNFNISSSLNITGTTLEWTVTDSQNVSGFTNGTGVSPIAINDVLINTSNAQGFVKYSVTSKLGNCVGGTIDYIVYVNPLPKPILTDGNICVDATTGVPYQGYLLDTQLSNLNFTYDWFLLNTTTNTYDQIAGANTSTYEAMAAGSYQVRVTDNDTNCIGEDTAIVIETFPATAITTTVSELTITVAVNPSGTGNLIYALDNGAWQESNIFTGVEPGTHTVLVSDLEGCTNLSIEVIVVDEAPTDLVMYPNPSFDILNFSNNNKVMSIQISNQLGQVVLTKDLNLKNGSINLSELNMGIYNIVFETESGTESHKIVKQ